MSYCVNCGVELAQSEARCPLCGVEVVNPADPASQGRGPRPYPHRIERINVQVNRRYTAAFLSLILLIPVFVTIFTDIMTGDGVSWSMYVVGSALVLFTSLLLPLLLKRLNAYVCVLLDGLAVLLFLLLIQFIVGKQAWVVPLGLPLTALATLYALLIAFLASPRRTMDFFIRAAIALSAAGVVVVGVECVIRFAAGTPVYPLWSMYALFPCLVLSGVLLILNKRARFKSELKRRFYV